jgi:hypothetical protein
VHPRDIVEPPRVWLEDAETDVKVSLAPGIGLAAQDLDDPDRAAGLETSLEIFAAMSRACARRGIRFVLVALPTKEAVLEDVALRHEELPHLDVLRRLCDNERRIVEITRAFCTKQDIELLHVLSPLREAVGRETLFGVGIDYHLEPPGYAIVADAVARHLTGSATGRRP